MLSWNITDLHKKLCSSQFCIMGNRSLAHKEFMVICTFWLLGFLLFCVFAFVSVHITSYLIYACAGVCRSHYLYNSKLLKGLFQLTNHKRAFLLTRLSICTKSTTHFIVCKSLQKKCEKSPVSLWLLHVVSK